ncbi:MAG TPA: hypothetical protein ENJ41_00895 [Oceanospirillales bacterium]|nr:hypothetical protein [Oceanospirillales bacterium]
MSFLEELENRNNRKGMEKSPRELWESSFKYFKYFVSILQKDKDSFAMEFNFIFLNLVTECQVIGPYEISRQQTDNELRLEISLFTQIEKSIRIKRKDKRSAELLKLKLYKDRINSSVQIDRKNNYHIELANVFPSVFRFILKNGKDFYLEYDNVCNSSNRSIKLATEDINEGTLDNIARYILGQNPDLYTETISEREKLKIREKIEQEKLKRAQRQEEIKANLKHQQELEEIAKAKTIKERSKKYMKQQSDKVKNTIVNKIDQLKSRFF